MATVAILAGLKRWSALPVRIADEQSAATVATRSSFAASIAAFVAGHGGQSGFRLLVDAQDAYAARILLARRAERTLDLQYYIWKRDRSGIMLLKEVHDAAARGVQVRLLLDDHGTSGLDRDLAALAQHPGISIRLFNPFVWRAAKLAGFAFHFERLNRRMHNKSFIADDAAAIVGGRNIGDEYFGVADVGMLADIDLLAVGPVAADIVDSFNAYWQSPLALPVEQLVRSSAAASAAGLKQEVERTYDEPQSVAYRDAIDRLDIVRQGEQRTLAMEWAKARLVVDDPVKSQGTASRDQLLATRLFEALGAPTRELRLVSAYFVPGKPLVDEFVRLVRSGVAVSILTNGAQSTDVGMVFAYYSKYRLALVDAGVRLFELRRAEQDRKPKRKLVRKTVQALGKSSGSAASGASSLHAKTFTVDGERLFVGSFNVDPRSIETNTELGVVIDSPVLAGAINDMLDVRLPASSLEVRQSTSGKLEWIDRSSGTERTLTTEPGITLPFRLAIRLLEHLPFERLM